jgi:hypothetical protein
VHWFRWNCENAECIPLDVDSFRHAAAVRERAARYYQSKFVWFWDHFAEYDDARIAVYSGQYDSARHDAPRLDPSIADDSASSFRKRASAGRLKVSPTAPASGGLASRQKLQGCQVRESLPFDSPSAQCKSRKNATRLSRFTLFLNTRDE